MLAGADRLGGVDNLAGANETSQQQQPRFVAFRPAMAGAVVGQHHRLDPRLEQIDGGLQNAIVGRDSRQIYARGSASSEIAQYAW